MAEPKHERDDMIETLAWNHGHPDAARYITASQRHLSHLVQGHISADRGQLASARYHSNMANEEYNVMEDARQMTYKQRIPYNSVMRTEQGWQAGVERKN